MKKFLPSCQRIIVISLLALGLVSLAGCGVKLSYHWLDWWLQSKLEDYVDLTHTQASYSQHAIDDFHEWHRYNALPDYSTFIDEVTSTLQKKPEINQKDVSELLQKIGQFWDESMLQLTPAAGKLLLQLSQQQLEEALQTAAKEEEKFIQKSEKRNKEERIERQIKRIHKQLKPWVGKLNDGQAQFVSQWAEQRVDNKLLAKQENDQWRQAMFSLWQSKLSEADTEQQLAELLTKPDKLWTDKYRATVKHNRQLALTLITQVLNSLTETQTQHLLNKLQDYQAIFDDLSQKAVPG